jgi:hypothetical protein
MTQHPALKKARARKLDIATAHVDRQECLSY